MQPPPEIYEVGKSTPQSNYYVEKIFLDALNNSFGLGLCENENSSIAIIQLSITIMAYIHEVRQNIVIVYCKSGELFSLEP